MKRTKPGIKTTEFWATMLGSLLVAGASEVGIDLSETCAASIAAMVMTYLVGRMVNKNSIHLTQRRKRNDGCTCRNRLTVPSAD